MKLLAGCIIVLVAFAGCRSTSSQKYTLEKIQDEYSKGLYSSCIQQIDKLIADEKVEKDFLFELKRIKAKCKFSLKDYEMSVSLISDVIDYFPDDRELYQMRGDSYQYLKKNELALKDYSVLINKFKSAENYNKRGVLYIRLGDLQLANKDIDSALKLDSTQCSVLNSKGVILIEEQNFEKGLEYYKKSLALCKNQRTYFNIGWVYDKMNMLDSACYYWKNSADSGYNEAIKYYKLKCVN